MPRARPVLATNAATAPQSPCEAALWARAERIRGGEWPQALRGAQVAVVAPAAGAGGRDERAGGAAVLEEAALALGARLSWLPVEGLCDPAPTRRASRSRALAALYDLIVCVDQPATLVEALARDTGRPVVTDVCVPGHPTRQVADRMSREAPADPAEVSSEAAWRRHHRLAVMAWLVSRVE